MSKNKVLLDIKKIILEPHLQSKINCIVCEEERWDGVCFDTEQEICAGCFIKRM